MTIFDYILIAASLLLGLIFLHPKLLRSRVWRATVTPLASIIGSGFLVAGPILGATAGRMAWLAMLALCMLAYLFGSAIRHNIQQIEPLLEQHPPRLVARLERASELMLSTAYFVSVAYYLNLFAAFALRLGNITDPFWIRVLASVVIAYVGVLGLRGGLAALERLEEKAVGLKLSLIGGLLIVLVIASAIAVGNGSFTWSTLPHTEGTRELQTLLGLVVLVQGFETSRYLGSAYDATTRIHTMRYAQWISTAIYLAFILLITRYFTDGLPSQGGETAIIDMLKPIGSALAPMIIVAALASQLSAAVADTNGAGGLLSETFSRKLSINFASAATALVAITMTWLANIYQIITFASQIFVGYYALQSLQAALSVWRLRRFAWVAVYGTGTLIALLVVVFAIPVAA